MTVPSGSWGGMHTQVGNNPGSVSWFNNPAAQASAHFCVAQEGPLSRWARSTGGRRGTTLRVRDWYGIEHADDGTPPTPPTSAASTDQHLTRSRGKLHRLGSTVGPVMGNQNPDGLGTGAATGTDTPHLHSGDQMTQYVSYPAYDENLAQESLSRSGTPVPHRRAGASAAGGLHAVKQTREGYTSPGMAVKGPSGQKPPGTAPTRYGAGGDDW